MFARAHHQQDGSLRRVTLHRLKVPLTTPYKLSLAEIQAFDTVLVQAQDSDGCTGFGEATLLTGYTNESIEQSWHLACALASRIAGESFHTAKNIIDGSRAVAPFTVTALNTAVEMLEHSAHLITDKPVVVPLLALVHAADAKALRREIEGLIDQGYDTLKVKIGFDVDADLARVGLIQQLVDGRARLRLDANQGYGREEARRFARSLDPEGIELLEQTCAAGDWQAAQSVAEVSRVPLMLDESIYDLADVDRAAALGVASYIKFKLMKAGSLARLSQALAHIRTRGMEPVLGNGVACDIGCWMEACMVSGNIHNAGEMNGFLKTKESLLQRPLTVEHGRMRLDADFQPRLNETVVARYRYACETFTSA
jgi:L-alanine-DL-glutamate epimerase-like enolase superfamily enzyme